MGQESDAIVGKKQIRNAGTRNMERENLRIGDLEQRSEHRINLVKRKTIHLYFLFFYS